MVKLFTAALVAIGIKNGVLILPWAVFKSPNLARDLLDFFNNSNIYIYSTMPMGSLVLATTSEVLSNLEFISTSSLPLALTVVGFKSVTA